MAWETPQEWSAEFLRSQKFNTEIRDKQRFLFKRPRATAIIRTGSNITLPTSMSFIDETNFVVEVETTGRPVLVTISGAFSRAVVAQAAHYAYFDVFCNGQHVSTGDYVGTSAASVAANESGQQRTFNLNFMITWLTTAGVYTVKPKWYSPNSMLCPVSVIPLVLTAEEV